MTLPCHHRLDQYLNAWIAAARISGDKKGPLFRSFKKGDKLTGDPMIRSDVLFMITTGSQDRASRSVISLRPRYPHARRIREVTTSRAGGRREIP
jgi:hypothetical protein